MAGGESVRLTVVVAASDRERLREVAERVSLKPGVVGRLLLQRGLEQVERDLALLVRPRATLNGGA